MNWLKLVKLVVVKLLRWFTRLIVIVCLFWTCAIILFSFYPVSYSTVMLSKQLSAWVSGNYQYRVKQHWVAGNRISPYMKLAVIASEDQKFAQHWGVDLKAIKYVLSRSNLNKPLRGASTLSQQTAKNLFLWNGHSWLRKAIELGLTLEIELIWSKEHILTVYLNIAEFGPAIFGVEQAARYYFNKSASKLNRQEAALLAAVLPNPLIYKVDKPSAYLIQRQHWILHQMDLLGGVSHLKKLQ